MTMRRFFHQADWRANKAVKSASAIFKLVSCFGLVLVERIVLILTNRSTGV